MKIGVTIEDVKSLAGIAGIDISDAEAVALREHLNKQSVGFSDIINAEASVPPLFDLEQDTRKATRRAR